MTKLFLIALLFFANTNTKAQEKKVAPTSSYLFKEIAQQDSLMFNAFNTQNIPLLKSFFSPDLEWFQDNSGLLNYNIVFLNFENNFKRNLNLNRTLVKNSLEVHPILNYGAIEIGTHEFRHIENGKEELGSFKFLMIWRLENEQWRITKVVSYDH